MSENIFESLLQQANETAEALEEKNKLQLFSRISKSGLIENFDSKIFLKLETPLKTMISLAERQGNKTAAKNLDDMLAAVEEIGIVLWFQTYACELLVKELLKDKDLETHFLKKFDATLGEIFKKAKEAPRDAS